MHSLCTRCASEAKACRGLQRRQRWDSWAQWGAAGGAGCRRGHLRGAVIAESHCCRVQRQRGASEAVACCRAGRNVALTRAPMTPSEVRRRYSKGRVLDTVFKNG